MASIPGGSVLRDPNAVTDTRNGPKDLAMRPLLSRRRQPARPRKVARNDLFRRGPSPMRNRGPVSGGISKC